MPKRRKNPKRRAPKRGTFEDLMRFAKGSPGDADALMVGYYLARGKRPPK